ncbi:glycosyltransferase [Flavobacteriaceae bacterium F89]|uniref:Glycosyltransferase n=1 Tax=Cerina litoralis TaxID=2874477 RepID=A0AAE3EU06_9FLAO|nr:glycosyltransferase family 2 protein [Cerina litoralis]MCG2460958.1 glycosyltransferase [Cerina litoralis]
MTDHLVSVITPVHNSEKFIVQCIESVISQTYSNWEHILIDDCSTDGSRDIILSYVEQDPRIKLFKLDKNSGAGVARNTGIELAKGKYIAFLDSDDLWYPKKLEEQLAFMVRNSFFFTFTSYDMVDENGQRLKKIVRTKQEVSYKSALYKNPIGCLTVIYDAETLGKHYMPKIRKRQDYALWLALLKKTTGYGLDEILSSYRTTKGSISSNKMNLLKYEWKIYREIEQLSFIKSLFYMFTAIFLKLKSYF